MSLRKHHNEDEHYNPSDFPAENESDAVLKHRREVRKSIEERLERKRLHDQLDEFDGDFDWDDFER